MFGDSHGYDPLGVLLRECVADGATDYRSLCAVGPLLTSWSGNGHGDLRGFRCPFLRLSDLRITKARARFRCRQWPIFDALVLPTAFRALEGRGISWALCATRRGRGKHQGPESD